ncbi:hypothetical protein PCANC_10528 [Puccinia coronata f. sp. avenae]|uniref:C2H2-type domain-containing protein n=1 Tax=Puccinia coronata f. sp. avenae TaxID=200324 RepID=A0A2N5VZA9_9BASI|nr:hypothetical protein PCANC_10528 [Puccinia coronata f. sp. avenae]
MSSQQLPSNPSSPIDPHNPLADQESRDAYLNTRRQEQADELEAPADGGPIRLSTRLRRYPSQIQLRDIPIPAATIPEPAATPVSQWLRTVVPVTPRSDQAFAPRSYWSSESDPSSHSTSVSSSLPPSRNSNSLFQTLEFNRRGLHSPEGISPTNPGYPVTGPSTSSAVRPPGSPAKKPSPLKGFNRLHGKKKHLSPLSIPRPRQIVAVVIPKTRVRPSKNKRQVGSSRTQLALPSSSIRPRDPPVFTCPICSLKLPLLNPLKEHIRLCHPDQYDSALERPKGPA